MSITRRPRLLATWAEIEDVVRSNLDPAMFSDRYADVFTGEERWAELPAGGGATFDWDPDSTYVRGGGALPRHGDAVGRAGGQGVRHRLLP
jgi:aconitase A